MRKQQAGFTLVELVMVIVILGILAVTALPKFIDLSGEAYQAQAEGYAGALASGSAINYAACKAGSAECITVSDCNLLGPTLEGGLPTGYAITANALVVGTPESCDLVLTVGTTTYTATFTGHAT